MADMTWEHAAEARAALNAIVTDPEHGAAALSSPRTMSNLLKDLLPDAPREKNLLVAAAEAGLADKLRGHVAEGMDSSTAIRLTASTFSDSSPLTPDACSWVAGEIAVALGISTPAEIGVPGTASAGADQFGQVQSTGPGSSYSSEAPTREHARPAARGFDPAGAEGTGQAASDNFGQSGAPSFDKAQARGPGQFSSQEPGQIPAQMRSPSATEQAGPGYQGSAEAFATAADPSYPGAQVHSYPQGPVASFQQPADHPQPAGYPQASSAG